jgi:hypothetical protein
LRCANLWQNDTATAGVAGQTLVICHPELTPAPTECVDAGSG